MKKKNVLKKLQKRIAGYEYTMKNGRGKFMAGFKKPGSQNGHK